MTDVDADDVLDALREQLVETETPVAAAPAIAERLPIGRRRVLDYLEILDARDDVESVTVGRGVAWYTPDVVHVQTEFPPAEPPAAPPEEPPAAESPPAEPPAEPPEESEAVDRGARDDRDQIVNDLDLPGDDVVLEERRDAVRAVLAFLDEKGEPTPKSELETLYDEYPAGYKHATSWWSNFMQVALGDLREHDVVELTNRSRGRWRTR